MFGKIGAGEIILILAIVLIVFGPTKLPALAKINEQTFLPASIYSYQHGYQNHYCMHFKNSKTDGTKKEDAFHQKNISHILKNKSKFLKIANMA